MARCEDLTGSGVAGVLSHCGDSEDAGGCGSCPWLITGAGVGGACWTTVSAMSERWTVVPSSKDVVRVTSNHLVLIGVPDHITFTTKVLGDNTRKVSVTSSRKVPVIHRLSLLEFTTNYLLVVSCLKRPLLLTDFLLQVGAWQIQRTLNTPIEQQFCW